VAVQSYSQFSPWNPASQTQAPFTQPPLPLQTEVVLNPKDLAGEALLSPDRFALQLDDLTHLAGDALLSPERLALQSYADTNANATITISAITFCIV